MNWEKLKANHFFKEPVEHVYTSTVFDQKEYDKLYENQNNLTHESWKAFNYKYRVDFELKENFCDINFQKEVICLWFFKERSDTTQAYVHVDKKQLTYTPNTFLITQSKKINFGNTKRKYIRNPFIQIDLPLSTWKEILKRFNKIS